MSNLLTSEEAKKLAETSHKDPAIQQDLVMITTMIAEKAKVGERKLILNRFLTPNYVTALKCLGYTVVPFSYSKNQGVRTYTEYMEISW